MASSQTGDEHGVLGFSAGQLRQARGRRAPAGVVYVFLTKIIIHYGTRTPTHTRPVHALQRRHPTIITASSAGGYSVHTLHISVAGFCAKVRDTVRGSTPLHLSYC